jgi:RNase P subunit RPR2
MIYLISENIKFYVKNWGDYQTLVEKSQKKELCNKCKAVLNDNDYLYRRKASNVKTYVCSKCGYFEIYIED